MDRSVAPVVSQSGVCFVLQEVFHTPARIVPTDLNRDVQEEKGWERGVRLIKELTTTDHCLVRDNGMSNKNREHKYVTNKSSMNLSLPRIPYWPLI